MGPTILPRLLLADPLTLPVVCTHPWSAATRNRATNAALAVGGVPAFCRWRITLLFSAAQIMGPTMLPRLLLAVSTARWCVYSSVVGGTCAIRATSTAAPVAVGGSATLRWQFSAVFGGAD
jgi:hypothetical protein